MRVLTWPSCIPKRYETRKPVTRVYTNAASLLSSFAMHNWLVMLGLSLALVAGFVTTVLAGPIQLRLAQILPFNGSPLGHASRFAIPCVADGTRDGRKDLPVGCRSAGKDGECKLPDSIWRLKESPFKFSEHNEGETWKD